MKRLLAILLTVTLFSLTMLSAGAVAMDDAEVGNVIITDGEWAYEKVNVYGYEIDEYIGSVAEVDVPWSFAKEYITSIGDRAFSGNTTITYVNTTSKIESLGEYAFNGCTNLRTVVLYDSLTDMGTGCFYGASSLTSINLQDTNIGEVPAYGFAECGISQLALPDSCTAIGNMAFYNASNLKKIMIPDSVATIADTAFAGCDDLVIYANRDSYAIAYAIEHEIPYFLMDADAYMIGDADEDDEVNIFDVTCIQRILAEFKVDDAERAAIRGDVSFDGLDIFDATTLQRYMAEMSVAPDLRIGEYAYYEDYE